MSTPQRSLPVDAQETETSLRARIKAMPNDGQAHYQLGAVLSTLGRYQDAIPWLERAAILLPGDVQSLLVLGFAFEKIGPKSAEENVLGQKIPEHLQAAIAAYEAALVRDPKILIGHFNLATVLLATYQISKAKACFVKLLHLEPRLDVARFGLGRTMQLLGDLSQAIRFYQAHLERRPEHWQVGCNLLFSQLCLGEEGPAAQLVAARGWASRLYQSTNQPPTNQPPTTPKIRRLSRKSNAILHVGFVSPDLRDHPVARFLRPFLRNLDRKNLSITAYSCANGADSSAIRPLFQSWRDIAQLDDATASKQITKDAPDILIDLAGHSANNRLPLFAQKLAPIQATWLGYPGTTGLAAIEYRFTDMIADPPGTERWFSEKLVRLPQFICFEPPTDAPSITAPPVLETGRIRFGSFNNLTKLSDVCLDLWARLLRAVPDSELMLKNPSLSDETVCARLIQRFVQRGIEAQRLMLRPASASYREHLTTYQELDIALDTFPYNGTTTSCEALWMGVPVLTLAGLCHRDRVGIALLTHAGYKEWAALTPDEFVRQGTALAANPMHLAFLRTRQRNQLYQAALCDAPAFTTGFTKALYRLAAHHRF